MGCIGNIGISNFRFIGTCYTSTFPDKIELNPKKDMTCAEQLNKK